MNNDFSGEDLIDALHLMINLPLSAVNCDQ